MGVALLILGGFFLILGVKGIEYSGDVVTSVWITGAGIGLVYGGLSFLSRAIRR